MGHYVVMELFGTFFLTMAVALVGEPMPVGLMLMAMIYVGGHVSGAHYNPAVSIASWMRGGLKNDELLGYIGAQVIGALLSLVVAQRITGSPFPLDLSGEGAPFNPFFMEMILVMVLCLVILTVAKTTQYKSSAVQGLVIGLSLAALLAMGSGMPVVLNPAISLGALMSAVFEGGGLGNLNVLFVYVMGPALGGALAAWVYAYLNDKK